LLSPDFVDRSLVPGQGPTREDFKRTHREFLDAFSTTSFTIVEQITEGDTVVTKYRHSGVSRGEFAGLPPTGKEETVEGIRIHRISGGKITEEWSSLDVVPIWEDLVQEIRERERVEQELRVARRIQQASLPKEVPQLEGWQISPYYQPAREVGGDFYDFHLLSEGRLGVLVGDATGKGVPAALVMSTTCGMLRLAAQSSSPGEMLQRVNEALHPNIPSNMFVTCFYAILDPKSGRLVYANAGHDLPYVRRGDECEELRARGMPLGLVPGMGYEEKEVVLDAGEGVFFYSDGLVEAHDPKGEMFGFPRLRELIAEHGEESSLEDFLLEKLYSFVGEGWEQEDDITLLTLRRSASLG
jgi:serine phosphatase RsbU (regulator of sigma subunit)/predicted ester cyclase